MKQLSIENFFFYTSLLANEDVKINWLQKHDPRDQKAKRTIHLFNYNQKQANWKQRTLWSAIPRSTIGEQGVKQDMPEYISWSIRRNATVLSPTIAYAAALKTIMSKADTPWGKKM